MRALKSSTTLSPVDTKERMQPRQHFLHVLHRELLHPYHVLWQVAPYISARDDRPQHRLQRVVLDESKNVNRFLESMRRRWKLNPCPPHLHTHCLLSLHSLSNAPAHVASGLIVTSY